MTKTTLSLAWAAIKATGGLEPSPAALELMAEIERPLQ